MQGIWVGLFSSNRSKRTRTRMSWSFESWISSWNHEVLFYARCEMEAEKDIRKLSRPKSSNSCRIYGYLEPLACFQGCGCADVRKLTTKPKQASLPSWG